MGRAEERTGNHLAGPGISAGPAALGAAAAARLRFCATDERHRAR
ncbi:hypothetical protein [Kitasatospora sp. NPDC015120]